MTDNPGPLAPLAQHHTAETCQTMADVRHEIDRLDRVLVQLLAERQSFMDAAARIKPHRGAVRDEARIADVVAKVHRAAAAAGLSAAIAEPVWQTLIDRCIAYEFESFDAADVTNQAREPTATKSVA